MAPDLHPQTVAFDWISRLVFIAAIGLILWSAVWFWRKKTPIEPHHTPKSLIVDGSYRLSRNPIYLALIMLTVASTIGHGSVVGILCSFGLWKVLDQRFAAPEEVLLRENFGAQADVYLRETRRWI